MSDEHKVGDAWRFDDGTTARVVVVVQPDPARGHFEPRIGLEGRGQPVHVGWLYGQGWERVEGAATISPTMPRGRPPQDDVTRDRMVRVRVTADQETRWRVAADAAGLDLSTWLRELADEAAAKESGR